MDKMKNDPFDPQLSMFSGEDIKAGKRTFNPGIIKSILEHYKETGFPYLKLSETEKEEEFYALAKMDTRKILEGKNFLSDSTGVALANSYHPHRYGVVCNNHRTALEVFSREEELRKCIEKCIRMNGKISDSKLRSMISIFEGVQVASNFPPGTAKAIYEHFVPNGGSIWDMSMGFGGRLLAAATSRNVVGYYGTDPSEKTFDGLVSMQDFLLKQTHGDKKFCLLKSGSEHPLPEMWPQMDFCFTSPPYFNTEKYAREETQSFLAYPYQDTWSNNFLGGTFRNCSKILTPKGRVAINIANVKTFMGLEKETIRQAEKNGFKLFDTYFLLYTMMPGKGEKNRQRGKTKKRSEPIFIFEKA
jgi:hypothetical protein